jgi:hypothetical protein
MIVSAEHECMWVSDVSNVNDMRLAVPNNTAPPDSRPVFRSMLSSRLLRVVALPAWFPAAVDLDRWTI